jgi:hypothetical protein
MILRRPPPCEWVEARCWEEHGRGHTEAQGLEPPRCQMGNQCKWSGSPSRDARTTQGFDRRRRHGGVLSGPTGRCRASAASGLGWRGPRHILIHSSPACLLWSPWKLGRVTALRRDRKRTAQLRRQALSCTASVVTNRFCGLFFGVRRGIRDPAIDRGLAPTAAMLADPNLLRKRAVAHLAVKRGPAEAGSLEDGPHP